MNRKIGIMQGRLLPKYLNRYQAHPVKYWKDEFPIAFQLGLDSIEFILDYNNYIVLFCKPLCFKFVRTHLNSSFFKLSNKSFS